MVLDGITPKGTATLPSQAVVSAANAFALSGRVEATDAMVDLVRCRLADPPSCDIKLTVNGFPGPFCCGHCLSRIAFVVVAATTLVVVLVL